MSFNTSKNWNNIVRIRMMELLRQRDFLALSLVAVIVGTVWAFIELADELVEGELHDVDLRLLYLLRNPADATDPIGPYWVEEWMRDITALGGVPVLTLLAFTVVLTLWMERHRAAAAWLTASILGAAIISPLFKYLFARERPAILAPELLPSSFSFPSGHAFMSAAVYLTIGALLTRVIPNRRTRTFVLLAALVLAFMVGVSRVYLGVHYPSDVLAGWTLGLCWAALCWIVAWRIQQRRG